MNVFAGTPASLPNSTQNNHYKSALDLIGNTPLLELSIENGKAKVYAKAEFQNPSGSIKDRMVANIIKQAEIRGELTQGQTIVEATSGNTGVSLAMIAAIKGYKAVIVAPDSISSVKKNLMKFYGAKILFTDSDEGIKATMDRARKVAKDSGAYPLNQFRNPDNPKARARASYYSKGDITSARSGANIHIAWSLSQVLSNKVNVVTVLPDSGQRYLSSYLR